MNYSNGKPIGGNYSGEQASGSGFGTIGRCTIGMTFEELQKTWKMRKYRKDNEDNHLGDEGMTDIHLCGENTDGQESR